ncbi:MAG TPA: universal stress protein [Terracidiphilus sp.]|nr:universal stress protein [Terracidiphilus sp.]
MNTETRLPFHTVLVAADLTHEGSRALRYAQQIAALHQSTLVVVHTIDPASYAFPEGVPAAAGIDEAGRAGLEVIEAETRAQGIPVHSVMETTVVYDRLLQAAADNHANLLVLGTRAATKAGRTALGIAARRLIAKAPCPVLTVPPDADAFIESPGRWHRVLVATDFSATSLSAVDHAQCVVDSHLAVIHATGPSTGEDRDRYLERLRFLAPTEEPLSYPVEHIVSAGEAGNEIVQHAREFEADLIVLGSPLNEPTPEDIERSTILQVIANVSCPVLCVPPAQAASAAEVAKEFAFSH